MPIVEVDGQELEFPDDMPEDQIKAVLQKKFSPQQPKPEGLESRAVRATMGALDPVMGVSQMMPRAIGSVAGALGFDNVEKIGDQLAGNMDKMAKSREDWYNQAKKNEGITGFDGMRLMGNVLSPMNALPVKGAAMLPKAASLGARIGQGALMGAASGSMTPVTDPAESFAMQKMKQLGMGAAVGGAIPAAGEAVARMIKPNVSDNVQMLIDSGVRPTPGQILGGRAQGIEDKLTSMPFLGGSITEARKRGFEDLNRAAANRALEPIGQTLPKSVGVGHEMVNYLDDTLGKAYDDILPSLTGKVDQEFTQRMDELTGMVSELPETMQKQFQNILKNNLNNKISPNGTITGESLKEIESVLGQKARGYMKSQDFDQQQLGDAIRQAQANVREWLARQNPAQADKLRAINEGWANYTRIREAAGSVGAKEGVFSPAQLSNRVRAMGGKTGYAKGKNLMQDLSDAAKDVLPNKYPDSGTAGRVGLGAIMADGGKHLLALPALPALMAGNAAYSRPGVALLEMMLANRPQGAQAVADGVRKITSPSDLARLLMGGARAPSVPATP